MNSILNIAQVITSVLLAGSILLQQRGGGLGGSFGGGNGGETFASRRGIQQKLYLATIALGILFVALAIANLFF